MESTAAIRRVIFQALKAKALSVTADAAEALIRVLKEWVMSVVLCNMANWWNNARDNLTDIKDKLSTIVDEIRDRIQKREG